MRLLTGLALALMTLAAGCTSDTGGSTRPASSGPSASASGPPASVSAPPASTSSTAPPVSPAPTRLCLSGTVTVLYPPADNPLRSTCVHVGTRVRITLKPPPHYAWAPVTSSAPDVVTVLGDEQAPDGALSATARAAASGTATLTSADTYTPDPHGPPSRRWQLTLTVVP